MRNDVYIKVTWFMEDNGSYLEFEFTNIDRKPVGVIAVTDLGKVSWDVIDLNYFDNVMDAVKFIMGKDCENRSHYETKDEDIIRCSNAGIYAQSRNIIINRKYNYANNVELYNNQYK